MQKTRKRLLRFSELLALPVRDAHGEQVGTLDDLEFEAADNRVAYVSVRLERGHAAGASPTVTVPWSAVSIETGDPVTVKVAVRRETLRRLARDPGDQ
jgi:sporulation protein YlmC with PRC-barrel domain